MNQKLNTLSVARRQLGQGMSEYIIITALVAVAGIGLFAAFGKTIQHQVSAMSRSMSGQNGDAEVTKARTDASDAASRADASNNLGTYTNTAKTSQ